MDYNVDCVGNYKFVLVLLLRLSYNLIEICNIIKYEYILAIFFRRKKSFSYYLKFNNKII